MQLNDYPKWINLNHDLALVEDDLRQIASLAGYEDASALAARILFERFGVDVAGSAL